MTITASIIADSMSLTGHRLTTFQLRYPRFIHAELMTHRVFSRNASSSRAIPVQKMIEEILRDPAMPIFWGSNKPGMQAGNELTDENLDVVKLLWLEQIAVSCHVANGMIARGLHKQIANRILEPWAHINVVVTATDYANFYLLRRHKDAQPEIKVLADAMWFQQQESVPMVLQQGQWHLPYVSQREDSKDVQAAKDQITGHGVLRVVPHADDILGILKKVSVARCARVSYLTHDGRRTSVDEDRKLFDKLMIGQPLHASPAEHQATPDIYDHYGRPMHSELHGNFTGWVQLRKTLEGEFLPG